MLWNEQFLSQQLIACIRLQYINARGYPHIPREIKFKKCLREIEIQKREYFISF